ncbi:class I adenylate-forming enzyme family protein [Sinorhizobium fredii]|uniref:class I adenylate-forming enzyme family protein n=1 Tax=Rhizobium fredii TaxID=380 RepID=UPI0005955F6C|nr:AMP-binding protein [Sinorhizobium fredii]WOS65484.1 AMP-binding protein [Sinorhizobium fredii GR64]
MNIADWLLATSLRAPDSPALLKGTAVDATYKEFAARAANIGAGLASRYGIAPGDRVAIFMANCTEYLEVLYGIWWCGAIAVPVNAKLHAKEVVWILDDAEADLLFTDHESRDLLVDFDADRMHSLKVVDVEAQPYIELRTGPAGSSPAWCVDDDIAWIFYTSGTTGRPKGAMLTHGNLVAMSLTYLADVDTAEASDCVLYAAPISHGAGLYNFVNVRVGARHVVPDSQGFEPAEILDLARSLRGITMFAAPTMVRRLVDTAEASGQSGDGIKTIVYGGGPMYLADIERALRVMGQRFVQIYGQGETPMTITALSRNAHENDGSPGYRHRLASVGTAHSCVAVRILDWDGNPLPAGDPGEIAVSGATVMQGYWNNPAATAQNLKDGWLLTGDIGRMDEAGYLTLTDRSKDVIISGGSNIYPREVEEVLLQHADVLEVSVIGRHDPEWGEIVVAYVVPRDATKIPEQELDALCLSALARFKRPKRYVAIEALPKNNNGKVLKTELRKLEA